MELSDAELYESGRIDFESKDFAGVERDVNLPWKKSAGKRSEKQLLAQLEREMEMARDRASVATSSGTKITLHRSGSVDISLDDGSDSEEELNRNAADRRGSSASRSLRSFEQERGRAFEIDAHSTASRTAALRSSNLDSSVYRNAEFAPKSPSRRSHGHMFDAASYLSNSHSQYNEQHGRSTAVVSAMSALQEKIRMLERDLEIEREKVITLRTELERAHHKAERVGDRLQEKERQISEVQIEKSRVMEQLNKQQLEGERLSGCLENAQAQVVSLEGMVGSLNSRVGELNTKLEEILRTKREAEDQHRQEIEESDREKDEIRKRAEFERTQRRDLQQQKEELEEYVQSLSEINQNLVAKLATVGKKKKKEKRLEAPRTGGYHTRKRAAAKVKNAATKEKNGGVSSSQLMQSKTFIQRRKLVQAPESSSEEESEDSEEYDYNDELLRSSGSRNRPRSSSVDSLDKQLARANFGRRVPFLSCQSTTPSFSIYANTQAALSDDRAYGYDDGVVASDLGCESPPPKEHRLEKKGVSALEASLRRELEEMRAEYQLELESVSNSELDDKAAHLTQLVDRIETKAQQLYVLEKIKLRERSPLRSPKAYERKVNALRVLQAYRESLDPTP